MIWVEIHRTFNYAWDLVLIGGEANNLRYAIEYFSQALQGEAERNVDRAITITRILETLKGRQALR